MLEHPTLRVDIHTRIVVVAGVARRVIVTSIVRRGVMRVGRRVVVTRVGRRVVAGVGRRVVVTRVGGGVVGAAVVRPISIGYRGVVAAIGTRVVIGAAIGAGVIVITAIGTGI